jgi:Uma2 family endonuclease
MSPTASRMPYDGWTTDDLDALPEDAIRRELVDGVLLVTPSPVHSHQNAVGALFSILEGGCPPDLKVCVDAEMRISHKKSLIPDLMVVTREAASRVPARFEPQEVVLAVEIVSPTSISIDRVLKPALYAGVGIASYWRIEPTEDFRLHAYELSGDGDVYAEAGSFDRAVKVGRPWPLEFDLGAIKPE